MPENKKYLIQIDGLEGQSVRDAAWWDEKKDALYKKYPNAQVFELSSYDENDARDTDQYMIGIKGYEGTSMRDASWYHEKKDALDQKFGKDATVTRIRHVDYWRDKGIADEEAINATRGEIDELRSQQSAYKRWTPEYDAIEGQIAEKQTALIGLEDSYNKNPRVQEYNEMMQEAAEEYKRQLPKMLRERINNPERAYYTDAVPLDEETVDTDAESGSKRPEIGPQKDNVSAAYGFEKTKKIAEDIRTGKVALPVNQRKLDAAESFLDAYDYLSENKSSVAQGMWYSIWESVGQEEFDEVHSVLSKLEDKYKNLNKISSEQIEETLTDAEKTLLEAYFLASEEEVKASGAFKGGEIAGESALIAGEMLLWSAATALTGGAAAPAGAASMTVSLGKGAINLSTKLLKGLGKWALKNSAKSLSFTALAPSTYKHIAQNKLQIGEDGRLKDETEDVLGYAAQEFIENFTEFSGDGLITGLKHLGKGAKYLGKAATENKVGKAILGTTSAFGKKFTNAVSKIGGTPLKKLGRWVANPKGMEIMKNMGFHGLPAEILEEFEGAVLNEMTGLDNEAFEHFFDEDNFGTMLIGFAPMTLFGAGVSAASMAHVSRKMSKAEKNLRNSLLGTIKDAKLVDSVIEQAKAANTSTDIANALSGITRTGKVSVEQMKLLTDFGKSVAAYKATFSGDYKKFLEEVRKLNEPYNLGQNMTEADLYDVSNAESAAMQGVVDSGLFERTAEGTEEPLFSDDILNTTSTELVSLVHTRGNEMSDSEKSAINNLIASKSVSEGLQDKLNEEANKEISKNLNIANSAAVDGMLTTGQHDGKTVYIKGKLQVENGQIVRPSDMGSYPVEIVNATTGETTTVDSNEVSNVKQENAGDYKIKVQAFTTAIFNERWEAARNQMSTGAKLSEVNQMVGQKVYINTDNGGMALVEVNQILPNGDIMIKGKKTDLGGQSTKIVPVDTFYGMLKRDSDGAVIKDKTAEAYAGEEDFREGTHTILIDGTPVEVEVISQDDAANQIRYQYTDANGNAKVGSSTIDEFVSAIQPVETAPVASETPAAPDVPEAPVEEAPAEAPVSEPAAQPEELNEPEPVVELDAESINWDELFERDKEAYFAELQNQFGEETADILNEEIEAAQAELDALGKAKTKNQNERLQNRNKKKALQSRIDALNGMVTRLTKPVAETTVETTADETADTAQDGISGAEFAAPEPTIVPMEKDPEPRNGIELAARELGLKNGGIKLLVESFKHHTGYGNAEVRKFFGLFRTKDKGGMTLEAAGERLMEMDREYDLGFFDQNDPNAGLNAILDAIGFNSTMGELRSFTARMIQEDAQREADAVYAYEMEQYEKVLDEVLRDEVFAEELMAGKAYTAEEYNELMTILAEEINDYDTGNQGEVDILHEAEDIGDLPASEGEAYGGIERSNQVLQESQPVQTSGERDSQRRGTNQDIVGEDANSQVYNGESSDNERGSSKEGFVSSLDEDMPDFTQKPERVPVAPKKVADPVEAAKNREKRLLDLVERNGVKDAFKRDKAYEAGKDVGDFFATYEEYEDYQAEATDFGEYNNDFERGVKASFDNRPSNEPHIGEENLSINSEAQSLAFDAVLEALDGNVEVEAVSDQQAENIRQASGANNEYMVSSDKPVFISNAALAVANIKMEKATPEQWLKMIEKTGGLKAAEDKWMGLSDWLKASDKKTLTKQEVLDFINENTIQIEEVNYVEIDYFKEDAKLISAINDEFLKLRQEAIDAGERIHDAGDIAYQQMVDKYGDDFSFGFGIDRGELYVSNRQAASAVTGVDLGVEREINETRLNYTTEGLENKKEIAIIVPTIEPWQTDDVHFGDAGNGRAVAWVRFGETEVTVQDATQQRLNEIYDRLDELEMKVSSTGITQDEYNERARLRKERDELQEIEPKTQRVLVIDEIQSKRHQEGRESGYKISREKADAEMDKFMKQMHDKYEFSSSTPFSEVFNDEEMRELARLNMQQHRATFGTTSVPDAPFDKNWHELAMKRMLRYAAENGYDAIAWTKGEQQAERYDIGGAVESIYYAGSFEEGVKDIDINLDSRRSGIIHLQVDNNGEVINEYNDLGDIENSQYIGKNLSEILGKELASKTLSLEEEQSLSGEGLRIGGEGMKGFYDKMLPAFMNKYGKKWGIKVEDIELPHVEQAGRVMHSVPVTDAMKGSVMEGQVMFMKRPNGTVYGWTDGKKIYLTEAGFNPNTPIHEYTHIWAKAMMQKNPKGWNSIKQLLKGTPIWNEVMNDANYSNIHNDEDAVASEALSRLSGSKNAAKMEQMAQKMIDEAKGTGQKLKVRGLIQNMKDALAKFWNWVGTNLFKIENFNSIDEITDRVLWDLVNKTDLGIADERTEKINEKANRKTFENKSLSSQNDGYTEEQTTDSGKLSEERRLYNPEGGKVSSESYSRFNPISKREGESDRQRDIRETRFLESFERLTSDERILLYTFLSEYLPKNSGALKSRTDAFVQSIDNAEFAQFVEDFVNDELNYREGLASAAVAKHGLIVGVNQGLAAVERMFYAFNEDEYNGTLFDRAIKLAKRFGVSVKLATRNPDGSFFNAYGSYNPNDNSITLDASLLLKGNEQELCKTIVHELLHSVVARAASIMSGRAVGTDGQFIDSQSLPKNVIDGINTLKEVYDAIKDDGTFQDTYGATSFEEMISEISDPKFRALLKAKSLWKKFLNGVCRILGIADESSEKSDALTEIESALDQIFASAENGELDTLYASYLGHLADGYTLEDLQQLSSGDVKTLLTQNVLFKTGIDPAETVRETARQVYDRVVNKRWQEFQRQFQDEFQPVRIAIDAIQQETGNIPIEDYENYPLMQNHAASRSRIEVENFKRRYYEPLIKSIDNIISTLIVSRGLQDTKENRAEIGREVRQYLIAKHGLERNMLYQETKGEMRDYAGLTSLFGLSDSDFEEAEMKAQEMIDSFENSLGRENDESGNMTAQSKAIEDLWKKINAATDKTLRHSYECGMLSRQQYDQIRSMFDFYIPLRGFDETTAEDVYAYARFEGNRFNPAVHTAKGRSSLADDPIATIMNMAESEIAQGNKNRAKLALYSYLLNRTRTDSQGNQVQNTLMQVESVWYVKSKDSDGNEVYTIAAPNHALGETYEQFEQRMQTLAANGDAIKSGKGKVDVGLRFQKKYNENEHYIYLKVNGEDKAIFINGDPKAANAINGRYPNKDHATFEKMRKVNRFLSSMFTNYSLEFTVRNIFRDAIYSRINIAMKEKDPKYRKKFRKNWWKNMFTVLGMLKKYRAGAYDNATLSEKERLFVEFMENGGQTGYTFINSVETHKAELEKTLVSMRNGSRKGIKITSKFKALLNGIEVLNESSELVTRFSAYETSRQMGRSILHSVKDAKEISVNFNTKGAQDGAGALGMIARWFGASKFFFNAAVQGVQNLKAMAAKGKGKFCGVACGMMASGVLMPIIQGTLASMLGYGDEEDYWNIPEYDRQNNICILVGGGDYIKIPLPIGFREMFGIGDMIMACACDRKFDGDIMNVSIDMANKIAAIALPINPFEGAANGLSLIESAATIVLPDAADFAFQWITNTDFKGAPIQKEYGYNKHDPEWTKAFANNPYWLTGFSKWCYELYPGLDWSPEKIDNTLSNLFGGMYTIAKKTTRVIEKAINDEDLKAKDFPVIGVFYGDGDSGKSRFLNSSYYEMKEYYDERIGEVNRVSKAFGYSLDEIFSGKRVGAHHPEVAKIYNSSYFDYDWMQQWYWGNYGRTKISHGAKNKTLGLDQTRRKINNLKNEISKNKNEQPTMEQQRELAKLQKQYDQMYETFVYEMLELD